MRVSCFPYSRLSAVFKKLEPRIDADEREYKIQDPHLFVSIRVYSWFQAFLFPPFSSVPIGVHRWQISFLATALG